MKHLTKYAAALSLSLALLNLTGCAEKPAAESSDTINASVQQENTEQTAPESGPPQPKTVQATAEAQPEEWTPDITQRKEIADSGSLCGTAYIGFVEPDSDKNTCREMFLNSSYEKMFTNIGEVPDEYIASSEGGVDLFLVIPGYGCNAVVYSWDLSEENDFAGEKGEVILRSDNGAPFLLKCNRSDIMPDTLIEITDKQGQTLSWSPTISLKDGTVFSNIQSGTSTVYDFTHYSVQTEE